VQAWKRAFYQVQPGAVLGGEGKFDADSQVVGKAGLDCGRRSHARRAAASPMPWMMQSKRSGDGKERWIFAITQQDTRPFNPARRLRSRPRGRRQLRHIWESTTQSLTDTTFDPALRIRGLGAGNGIGVDPMQMTR
jgi:hypothetical protein